MKYVSIFALALLAAVPALAQNDMSWVSHSGSDVNPCTLALPCGTFQVAYNHTNNNGIVKAFDAGEYGPVSIGKPITIDGNGVGASIQIASGSAGVTVTAGTPVEIRNLAIRAPGGCVSCEGIYANLVAGGNITIDNVSISGTLFDGLYLDLGGASGGAVQIYRLTVSGASRTRIGLKNATFIVSDSVVRNSNYGIAVYGAGIVTQAVIERSQIISNAGTGLFVQNNGSTATVRISDCLISGNLMGTDTSLGGQIITLRNNTWTDNTTDGSTPFSVSLK
jgi:hypothetical protein